MSAADVEQYAGYLSAQLAKFQEFAGFGGNVWDTGRLRAAGKAWPSNEDAYRGPWRTVRPYVSEEFRLWVDEYAGSRLTFSEWKAQAIEERRREASRVRAYVDSAEYCTDSLEQWAELNARRDSLIVEARERGATFAALQASTGMSRMALHNIVTRAKRDAVPDAVPAEWVEVDGELCEVF